jgi:glycosyltransferase involved in cell wall biosynthesis
MPQDMLSVVLCTYNRADNLAIALGTVVAQASSSAFQYEVVVIDDGSTDHTRETVEQIAAASPVPVRYIFESARGGIAVARNRGVNEARGNWIVFFDDDQLAAPDWLAQLYAVVTAHGAKCVGGARRLDLPESILHGLGPVCRGILGENLYTGAPARLTGKELPTTGSLLLSRAIFDAVGLFDTTLTSSGEDSDLLGRSRRAGFEIWTAPAAMVAHMIPPHRREAPYFRWVSLRWGSHFASIDAKNHGPAMLLAITLARCIQALLFHAPRLLIACMRGDGATALDRKCMLWRAWGYVRTAGHLLAPGLLPQRAFLEFLEFRGERALFAQKDAAA